MRKPYRIKSEHKLCAFCQSPNIEIGETYVPSLTLIEKPKGTIERVTAECKECGAKWYIFPQFLVIDKGRLPTTNARDIADSLKTLMKTLTCDVNMIVTEPCKAPNTTIECNERGVEITYPMSLKMVVTVDANTNVFRFTIS